MKTLGRMAWIVVALGACGGSGTTPTTPDVPATPDAAATTTPDAAATPTDVVAMMPDVAEMKDHLAKHVTYPATRAQVLATCADTQEFTAAQRKWVEDHLPEGTYNSADEVTKALGV